MDDFFSSKEFWIPLMQIIGADIVLSGDNAVVIALAARSLPARQQRAAVILGAGAAVFLRVVLTLFAVALLSVPYLKFIGAALLLWIGIKLLLPEKGDHNIASSDHLFGAIRTILIADFVMSLDNVIAVAAAAKDSKTLLALGLLISIPLVVFGSTIILKLMGRYPVIITLGGALLGYVAGEMAVADPSIKTWVDENLPILHQLAAIGGAILVVLVGKILAKKKMATPKPTNDE